MGSFSLCIVCLGIACAWATQFASKEISFSDSSSQGGGLGIYKGKPTTIEEHPYLVGVTSLGKFRCAATIVADSHVLLSADCVYAKDTKYLGVVAGSQDGVTGKNYTVLQKFVHPSFNNSDYDYALLQIKGKFEWSSKVKKVTLPTSAPKVGSQLVITGWGTQNKSDSVLLEGKMKLISLEKCKKIYSDIGFNVTERMGCIYNKGKTTPCEGDWSDPVTQGEVLHYFFIAMACEGECSSKARPAVCTSVYAGLPWIKNITKIE